MAVLHNLSSSRLLSSENIPDYLKGYTLIHHWEADDWTVGTNWIDRVGGLIFTRSGNPIKQDGLIAVCYNKGYFQLNANAAAPNGVNMGSLWVVEVEGMVEEHSLPSGKTQSVVDFGSITVASHAFAPFAVNYSGIIGFNPKFTGNSSASLYLNSFDFTPYYGKLAKTAIGTKEINSDTVLPFYVLEGEVHNSPNTLTKAQSLFNRNFNSSTLNVGCVSFLGPSYDNVDDYKYIKSIKIYTKYQ